MNDRLADKAGQANESRSRQRVAAAEASATASANPTATHKDAMRPMDTASPMAAGPAGVPGRRVGCQPADQTPAGGRRREGQLVLRIRSGFGMAFSPKGSL